MKSLSDKMYCFRRICLILGICALSACSVGPDFTHPTTPTPASYTSSKDTPLTGAQRIMLGNKVAGDWWTLFKSPTLNQTIKLAMANNYDVAAAKATLTQAQEEVSAALGALWPQISLDATAGGQKYGAALFGPTNITIPSFAYYIVGPSLTFPLDVFGKQRRTVEAQKALAEYQWHELNSAYLSLSASVTTQALNLAAIKTQIATVKRIIAEDQRNAALVETAYKIGSVNRVDVLSAQSQLAADQTLLPPLLQQASIARHALSVLVGKAPADWQPPEFTLGQFTLPRQLPVSLPSALVRQRPDILAAEAQLHAASAAIGIATANEYPNLTLNGTLTQQALTPANLFKPNMTAWNPTANIVQPIFSGGSLRAQRRAAEATYQAALATYQQTVLKAFGQVADTLQALAHDAQTLAAEQRALKTAAESLRLARLSYKEGDTGLLQLLDAQRLYSQAQFGVNQAIAQRYFDTILLFLNLGGTRIS